MRKQHMKGVILFLGIMGSLLFLPVLNIYAYGPGGAEKGKDHPRGEKYREEMKEKLGLSPEQEKQLQEHREKHRAQMETLREQIKGKREQIRSELQKESFDENAVKQIHGELKSLKTQSEDYRLDGILEVRKILTPDQFHKFSDMKDDWKERKKNGFEERRMKKDQEPMDGPEENPSESSAPEAIP